VTESAVTGAAFVTVLPGVMSAAAVAGTRREANDAAMTVRRTAESCSRHVTAA
jgi:hypothetical protein